MTVYVVMVNDTHADPTPYVFTTPDAAITYARQVARRYARDLEDIDESRTPRGWLYLAHYAPDSSVWVVPAEVDAAP